MGLLSKPDLVTISSLYDIFLYVLFLTTAFSVFLKESGLRLASILTGIVAFGLIWFSAATFTPEYHQSPLYVPSVDDEVEESFF
jgi:ABC-type transport system involved in cytochrome c biogenesis permease subunit